MGLVPMGLVPSARVAWLQRHGPSLTKYPSASFRGRHTVDSHEFQTITGLANAQAPTADPDGSHRSVVVTRTRDGFGLSLVDGRGSLDLL